MIIGYLTMVTYLVIIGHLPMVIGNLPKGQVYDHSQVTMG